jgi:iron complex outermembrane recepter protein
MSKNKSPKMAFTRKPCVIATGIAISLMAAQSYAQTPAPAAATEKVEKIEVTGSRISSANLESTSPITTIDAQAIKTDGVRSVESLLNNLPQVFADQGSTVVNGSTGTANVNLRGLGANRTLVLVNGRRLPAGSPTNVAADLNQIPAPLIKRIEVLTGGAGAVYGSDAVAGVVNFIMNNKFEGVQLELNQSFYNHQQNGTKGVADQVAARAVSNPSQYSVPGDKSSDGKIFDASMLMGANFANGKGNATVFFSYKKENALLQSERDFSACSLDVNNPFVQSCGGSGTNATGRITNLATGVRYTNDPNGVARRFANATDQYNFGPLNFYQRPSERYSANVFANYDILPNANLYSEFSFTDYLTVAQIAPGGDFGTVANVAFDNPLLSPSWRTALGLVNAGDTADIVIQRRNVEGGGRQSEYRNTSFRTVVGVKGDIGNWSYDAFMQTAKVIYSQSDKNYFSSTRLARSYDVVNVNGVATCRSVVDGTDPACVPYNVFRTGAVTPAQLAYLAVAGQRKGSTEQMIQGASVTSDLGNYGIKLPSASNGVAVAFGVERRTEKLGLETDALSTSGDLSGSGGPAIGLSGKYTVKDFFTEVRAPLIEGKQFADLLSVNASYRNSDFSTGIKTNTYGGGIDWAPIKQARLRGSYQVAVRAANLVELFTVAGIGLFDGSDPCAGTAPTASAAACARTGVTAAQYGTIQESPAGQYNQFGGGNASLSPEKAKSYTLGGVFTPIPALSLSIDYFNIKVDNTIGSVSAQTTIEKCIETGAAVFCNNIQRDRLGTLWLLQQGFVKANNVNLGGTSTSGFDLGVVFSQKMAGFGSLSLGINGTYLKTLVTEEIKGQGSFDCVGLYGQNKCGSPNPKWRSKTRLSWATPWNFDASVTWRHFDSVRDQASSSNPLLNNGDKDPATGSPVHAPYARLGQRNYLDIAGAWTVTKQLTVSGGINNLLDRDPPVTALLPVGQGNGNTFPSVYDALGRRIFVNATYKF